MNSFSAQTHHLTKRYYWVYVYTSSSPTTNNKRETITTSNMQGLHIDLLVSILSLADRSTLAACLRVSRLFLQVAGPILYREIPFGPALSSVQDSDNGNGNGYSKIKRDLLECTRTMNIPSHPGSCCGLAEVSDLLPNLNTVRLSDQSPWYTYCHIGSNGPSSNLIFPWECSLLKQLRPSTLVLQDTLPPTSRAHVGFGSSFLQPTVRRIVITLQYGCFWIWGAEGTRMLDRLGPTVEEIVLAFGPWESGWKSSSSWKKDWPGSPCVASQIACMALEGHWRVTVVGSDNFNIEWAGEDEPESVVHRKVEDIQARSTLAKDKDETDSWIPRLDDNVATQEVQKRISFVDLDDWLKEEGKGVLAEDQLNSWRSMRSKQRQAKLSGRRISPPDPYFSPGLYWSS
ncbi:hypothetical protein BCR39DRAFT_517874 [Naematelia encephala]|uniref:F-box domain-containing protein n=1 Tax=Naematelia encephala TaxID=71784 RepID=A0A1Y2BHV4_9TREE|nr:hypothetical protein BCR39DRAFT_517874 [Naematelia encephala]